MKASKKAKLEADSVTCLFCREGFSATKTFVADDLGNITKHDFDAGWLFGHFVRPVPGIHELSDLLSEVEDLPNLFLIRGTLCDPALVDQPVRRTGAGEGGNFSGNFMTPPQGRRWVLIDVDKLKLPTGLTLTQRHLTKIIRWMADQMPPELHDVTFHWQLSSSAGVFNTDTVSAHFWFWLSKPVPDADLKSWASAFNAQSTTLQIDTSLFRHIQPHYTAKPIFVGLQDPFPVRSGLMVGKQDAATVMPPAVQMPVPVASPMAPRAKLIGAGVSGFDAIVASIGDHPGGSGFRTPLLRAAASYVRTHGADGTDAEALYEMLREAVLRADASGHTPDEIEERASRKTIMPMIHSALPKYGNRQSAHAPHLKKGVPPPAKGVSSLGKDELVERVRDFFDF